MITNLYEKDAEVVGGHEIDVVQNNIRNARLHRVLEQMSRLTLFILECDSNNSSSKVRPSDIRYIRQQWDLVKGEFSFSIADENNDLPSGSYEYAYKIYTIHQKEVARVRNVKLKAVLAEVWDTMNVLLSVDSSNLQDFTAAVDAADVQSRLDFVDRVLDRWVGRGADFNDTGIKAPDYRILGSVVPDVDSDWASVLEPSKRLPDPRWPDAPDTKSE